MRIGGRGCPNCGSHTTKTARTSDCWCETCGRKWVPCNPNCRGYQLDVRHSDGPCVIGCKECGVDNRIARTWPEAHRMLVEWLMRNVDKMDSTVGRFPGNAAQHRATKTASK